MTVKELYDWAKKEGKENLELNYEGDEGFPFVLDINSEYASDDSIRLCVDPREMEPGGDFYGMIFDGKNFHYIIANREVTEEEYWGIESEE